MDGNYFDQIAQEIIKQKQLMEQLEAENRELRQRLADLRAGRGIFVEIAGSRFALRDSASPRDHLARTW
jgi:cell division protein FtsB